jgi:hypothetical protein
MARPKKIAYALIGTAKLNDSSVKPVPLKVVL